MSLLKKRFESVTKVLKTLQMFVEGGGGKKAVELHTLMRKRLFARKRIQLLLDSNSQFLELGTFAGLAMDYGNIPAAGSVIGIGKINNRYCLIGSNDTTVKGGVSFPITVQKHIRMQNISRLNHLPCIYLIDSGGAFLPLQADIFPDAEHGGRVFFNEAMLSSLGIPQLSIVCGSSTAGGAYGPTMTEESIIINKFGTLFLGGPPLVKAATGEIVSDQELGGADLHCRVSGCLDYFANSEEEAYEICRESVSSLNLPIHSNNEEVIEPLLSDVNLDSFSVQDSLAKEDIYQILKGICDGSKFHEFKKQFGENLICGFSTIYGNLIGILVNCGPISCQDGQKGAHFIEICAKRHIPLVFLQNSGCPQCIHYDNNDTLVKERAKMVSAHCSTNIPKIVINIGGCFADDNFYMCGVPFDCNFMFSWPLAHVMNEEDLKRQKYVKNDTFDDFQGENLETCLKLFYDPSSAFFRASRMFIDNIILPSQTRSVLGMCLDITLTKTSHAILSKEQNSAIFRM